MINTNYFFLPVDFFKDERVRFIETLTDGADILIYYFELIRLATRQNNGGKIRYDHRTERTKEAVDFITQTYIDKSSRALSILSKCGLIDRHIGYFVIKDWELFQPLDSCGEDVKT